MQGKRAGFVSQALGAALDFGVVLAADFGVLLVFGFVRFLLTSKAFEMPSPVPSSTSLSSS